MHIFILFSTSFFYSIQHFRRNCKCEAVRFMIIYKTEKNQKIIKKGLDKTRKFCYNNIRSNAGVAQWQSSWFVISRLMVRLRSPAPKEFRYSTWTLYGGIPERPKGADCKSVVTDFAGPNPASPTKKSDASASDFFIQSVGVAYHWRAKCGVYHQGRFVALVSHHAPACISLRLDDMQHFVLMICNSFGIDDIHAYRRDRVRWFECIA